MVYRINFRVYGRIRLCPVEFTATSAHRRRAVQARLEFTDQLPDARMVPRREVRHLGALGRRMPARARQLVCAVHVSPGPSRLRVAPRRIRTSVHERLQGSGELVERRAFRSGRAVEILQGKRRKIFHGAGQLPRQFRQLELKVSAVELRERRAAQGHYRPAGRRRQRNKDCASA